MTPAEVWTEQMSGCFVSGDVEDSGRNKVTETGKGGTQEWETRDGRDGGLWG